MGTNKGLSKLHNKATYSGRSNGQRCDLLEIGKGKLDYYVANLKISFMINKNLWMIR